MNFVSINPEITTNIEDINKPVKTGNTVSNKIPFLSIGLKLPQRSNNVQPSISEAPILETYK